MQGKETNNLWFSMPTTDKKHRGHQNNIPLICGMKLAIERPHQQYRSSLFVKLRALVVAISKNDDSNIENLTVELSRYGNR